MASATGSMEGIWLQSRLRAGKEGLAIPWFYATSSRCSVGSPLRQKNEGRGGHGRDKGLE